MPILPRASGQGDSKAFLAGGSTTSAGTALSQQRNGHKLWELRRVGVSSLPSPATTNVCLAAETPLCSGESWGTLARQGDPKPSVSSSGEHLAGHQRLVSLTLLLPVTPCHSPSQQHWWWHQGRAQPRRAAAPEEHL